MSFKEDISKRRSERMDMDAGVEFIVDADVLQASAVNVSQTGVCFTTKTPLHIVMRLKVDGKTEEHRARLIWVRTTKDDHLAFGLEYSEDDDTRKPATVNPS